MLQEKTPAPDFTLQNSSGQDVKLSDFIGKKVILYFYPKDDTPGCTVEACAFRDNFPDFQSINAVIIGISPDAPESHKKFRNKFDLPFLLLADTDRTVLRLYEAEKEKMMYGKKRMGVQRSTYIIDEEGTIIKVYPNVKPDGHAREILDFIDSLNQ